jgi:hypothetical protein
MWSWWQPLESVRPLWLILAACVTVALDTVESPWNAATADAAQMKQITPIRYFFMLFSEE